MSDLRVTPSQLERSRSQLSVRSYFEPQLFQRVGGSFLSGKYGGHDRAGGDLRVHRWLALLHA